LQWKIEELFVEGATDMNRRHFITLLGGSTLVPFFLDRVTAQGASRTMTSDKIKRSEEEWRELLTPDQFRVLREEGTERPGTSPLLDEKRSGNYVCAGCGQPLFSAAMKYDSGTGWPSYFTALEGALETRRDFRLLLPRTEYHCSRCGGHQGHLFDDGPQPTGLRYCNNGVALKFVPEVE
jgi:peptide-methionine (R)-S-oxide reductase